LACGGTQFPDRRSFTERIREGGIAAMELVARELKAMGVYTARSLSYAGVEYDILAHDLTSDQIADFDAYSDAWTIIHTNMQEALEAAGVVDGLTASTLNGQALAAARGRFEQPPELGPLERLSPLVAMRGGPTAALTQRAGGGRPVPRVAQRCMEAIA
jgi:hypothetical protein